MSRLGDLIVEYGPYEAADVGPPWMAELRPADFDALRDELIELRAASADRDRANELSDRIAAELRLVTRERDSLGRRCAVRFEQTQALKAHLTAHCSCDGAATNRVTS